jgi:PQQ-like domain/Phosphoesterase family
MSSPDWSSTAIFLTWDDCGCFYDHVNPEQYNPEWGGTGTYDCVTIAYGAATGNQLWVARLNGGAVEDNSGAAVTTGPDGGSVYVTGFIAVGGSRPERKMVTVAYNTANGHARWTRTFGNPGTGSALAVSPDGSVVYAGGNSERYGTKSDLTLVAYDAGTGSREWAGRFEVPGQGYSFANSVAVSPDGSRVYAGGMEAGGPKGERLVTLAVDPSGSKQWQRTYTGKRNGLNAAAGMVVSPGGASLYVTGATQDRGTWYDYTTLAYDAATGASIWVARYVGPVKNDDASAIGVSPDGSAVFVTGGSQGHRTRFDLETVAYSTS